MDEDVRAAIRAVRSGDHEAFSRVVERCQARLFALALVLTREPSAAEEVAQDAFVRAFNNLEMYDETRPFYPWLATIAVRLAQNWLHRRACLVNREDQAAPPDLAAASADPLAALIADEEGRRLWRTVAALPPGERAAAILRYRQEMSVRDVARALGVTDGTVKTLLFRARRRLRQAADRREREENEP